ncbi:MAG: hypothetical protein COA78_15105 [Blastopirellula sp.]|nr:MAG: hypothetical protein COA78_15105 [Blastopirellula sp.]
MNTQPKQIKGLNGLRALACLAVFGVHFQQITGVSGSLGPFDVTRFFENGNTGVCLFFGLSGFLLSLPLWRSELSASSGPWLGKYLRSRAVRIVPVYYICLTALVIFQRHWTSGGKLADTLSHYLFVNNLSERFFYQISSPFWSIALQVQFYVVLPLVFWLLCRASSNKSIQVSFILALSLGCYVLHYFIMECGDQIGTNFGIQDFVTSRSTVFSHSVLAHMPHLLWGVFAGWLYLKLMASKSSFRRTGLCEATVWISGLAVLVILGTSLDEVLQVPHGRYNFPFVPALITAIIACTPLTTAACWLLDSLPLRRLGEISFGVYVFHLPCMKLVGRVLPLIDYSAKENSLLFAILSFGLSIAVATISYIAIERPLLRYVHQNDKRASLTEKT